MDRCRKRLPDEPLNRHLLEQEEWSNNDDDDRPAAEAQALPIMSARRRPGGCPSLIMPRVYGRRPVIADRFLLILPVCNICKRTVRFIWNLE